MEAVPKEAVSKEAALETLREYTRDLPPLAAIQAAVADYDGHRLRLVAPLAANVNDKGTAFGGSMTSLMTYAGWGLVTLQLQQAGARADVFVADSTVRYLKPLYADLRAAMPARCRCRPRSRLGRAGGGIPAGSRRRAPRRDW